MMPGVEVDITGGVAVPVPPVGVVYHKMLLPEAPIIGGGAFWQMKVPAPLICGAGGMLLTTTVADEGCDVQPFKEALTV